ncbi:MAG: tetratricopeptide repeat protein [Candidatus Omnitrophica bacterium]|nr:tetratricopeptide repeat protein [Candidatus Omnitrophota bacterium]
MAYKISATRKFLLAVFGVFCCVIFIELSLRIGAAAYFFQQRYRNQLAIKQDGVYRILCLGESTTANQYPSFLETLLNKRGIGIEFKVIDKGIPGRHTSDILDSLELNLNAYHPDMVISMMGINDMGSHMPYEAVSGSNAVKFIRSLRIYKFARVLWLHIVTRLKGAPPGKQSLRIRTIIPQASGYNELPGTGKDKEIDPNEYWLYVSLGQAYRKQGRFPEAEAAFKKAMTVNPQNNWLDIGLGQSYREQGRRSEAEASFRGVKEFPAIKDSSYFERGWFYERQGKYSAAEAVFKKAIKVNPRDVRAYISLGQLYRNQGRLSGAESLFKKAIALDPANDWIYFELGWVYLRQDRCFEAEALFKKARDDNPGNEWPYMGLGWVYRVIGKFSEAEEVFRNAIDVNPQNDWSYIGLGQACRAQGRLPEAEAAFRKAREVNPKNNRAYFELGWIFQNQSRHLETEFLFSKAIEGDPQNAWLYVGLGQSCREQGRFSEAEAAFKKALELDPRNDWARGILKVLYIEMGDMRLARGCEQQAKGLRKSYYPRVVIDNYRKLKTVLDERGIVYVCMQYPLRSIEPLKEIFRGEAGDIIFVDNQKVFREALERRGYNEYFTDMVGGDFGHCTPKGNRLLAENIADVILEKVFAVKIKYAE